MGACLSICGLGQLACCAGSTACSLLSCCSAFNSPRILYSLMLILVTITGWIMGIPNVSNWLKNWVPWCWHKPSITETITNLNPVKIATETFFSNGSGQVSNGTSTICDEFTGYVAVYRLMFATTLFFVVFGFIMIKVKSSRDPRVQLHNGLWLIKYLILVGGIVGAFYIPASNGFYEVWKYFGLVGAFLFLLIQFFFIITFADDWAISWVSKMEEEDSNGYYFSLLFFTFINFVLTFTAFVLFYVYYTGTACGIHKFFISINLVLSVALPVISILPKIQEHQPSSGLLQSSVVSIYLAYLTWSALNNSPYTDCKPTILGGGSTSLDTQSFISLVICLACVLYSSMRLSSRSNFEKIQGVSSLGNDDSSVSSNTHLTSGTDDEEDRSNWSYSYFIFALGTLYLMMTLTNWYTPTESYKHFGESTSSLWIKMSSSWICALLYLWTLLAPILLGEWRDFS